MITNLYCDIEKIINLKKQGYKIVISIGTVSKNKNQKLAIDAISCIRESSKNTILIIVGGNEDVLVDYVTNEGIEGIFFTGAVDPQIVDLLLEVSDLYVMTSLNEGFGLPVVEAYSKGVPAVIPKNIDAHYDLFFEEATLTYTEYTPRNLEKAIYEALNRSWDKKQIKRISTHFDSNKCAKKYSDFLTSAAQARCFQMELGEIEELIYNAIHRLSRGN